MATAGLTPFRHEALLYAGVDEFAASACAFIRGGLEAGEPTLVLVARAKIERLRDELVGAADNVVFADIRAVGANPGLIIPAWREFLDRNAAPGIAMRGIGEPVWAERDPITLVECQRHERLLNLAFDGTSSWWLLCPYDTTALPPEVIAEAERSHPIVTDGSASRPSGHYEAVAADGTLDTPLEAVPVTAEDFVFTWQSLAEVRVRVARTAARAGLLSARVDDLVMATNEVATNSLRHGGGAGRLRTWTTDLAVVCEVSDAGRVTSALVDRQRPAAGSAASRGLWLVNQVCDLVQLRSSAAGTTVRLRMQMS